MTSRDCQGRLQERIQWVEPRVGHITAESDDWGRSARPRTQPGNPRGRDHNSILGKMGKLRLPQGSDLSWVMQRTRSQLNGPGSQGPDAAQLPAIVPPLPPELLWSW